MKKIGRFILLIIGLNAGVWSVVLAGYHKNHPQDVMIQSADVNAKEKSTLSDDITKQMEAVSAKITTLYGNMKEATAPQQDAIKKQIQVLDGKRADLKGELAELQSGVSESWSVYKTRVEKKIKDVQDYLK